MDTFEVEWITRLVRLESAVQEIPIELAFTVVQAQYGHMLRDGELDAVRNRLLEAAPLLSEAEIEQHAEWIARRVRVRRVMGASIATHVNLVRQILDTES